MQYFNNKELTHATDDATARLMRAHLIDAIVPWLWAREQNEVCSICSKYAEIEGKPNTQIACEDMWAS